MKKRKGGPGRPQTMSAFLSSCGSTAGLSGSSSQTSLAALPSVTLPISAASVPFITPPAAGSVPLVAPPALVPLVAPPPPPPPPPAPHLSSSECEHQEMAVRGHNKGVPSWNSGGKIEVEFNELFQPVGNNAKLLRSQLGTMVRDGHKIPLTKLSWNSVEDSSKERIWAEVQRNVLNVPEGFKPICLRMCNSMWKDFKGKIKSKHYKKQKNDPKLASKHPSQVLPEQWIELIAYWRSEVIEKQSVQNSKNRDKHGPSHVTGRKSFAEIKHELQKSGQSTDKMSVWIKSRNTNDPDVMLAIKDYNDLLSMEPEDQQHLTVVKDKIFHLIIGADGHGYCRTYGSSAPPRLVQPGSSSTPTGNGVNIEQVTQQVAKRLEKQFEKKYEDMRAEFIKRLEHPDMINAYSQAQTTSGLPTESIGDGALILSTDEDLIVSEGNVEETESVGVAE